MIGGTHAVRVWARAVPTDLRQGFNGLSALVERELDHDLRRGDFYLFVNRRRSACRVLLYDGTGLCLFAKKLTDRRFAKLWGQDDSGGALRLTTAELNLFLEGTVRVRRQVGKPRKMR